MEIQLMPFLNFLLIVGVGVMQVLLMRRVGRMERKMLAPPEVRVPYQRADEGDEEEYVAASNIRRLRDEHRRKESL